MIPITKTTAQAGIPTVIIVRWKAFNPEKHHFLDLLRYGLMCLDVLLNEDDNFTINGVRILNDMEGFSLAYIKHLTPTLCKKTIMLIQSAYPIRLKGLYFLNSPAVYEIFLNMFVPFFSEKLKSRVKFYNPQCTLYKS